MKEWFDLLGLSAHFMTALVIGGTVYKLFNWAQVRLPVTSHYAKSWLLGTSVAVSLGAALLELNGLILGHRWYDPRRFLLSLLPACIALAWLMLADFDNRDPTSISSALSFIRSLMSAQPSTIAVTVAVFFASTLLAFAIYDRSTRRLPRPVTNSGAARAFLILFLSCLGLAYLGSAVIAAWMGGLLMAVLALFAPFVFKIPTCQNAQDFGCTVSGQIDAALTVLSHCFFVMAGLPLLPILLLSATFVLAVLSFPQAERAAAFIARKYFSVTDQTLALEKPMDFLAPVAAVIAFAITSAVGLLLRMIG